MRISFLLALLSPLSFSAPLTPQEPTDFVGHWEGRLEAISLAFDVDLAHADGAWSGDVTIPAQGVTDRPLVEFELKDGVLRFRIEGIPGDPTFRVAQVEGAERLTGALTQGEADLEVVLERAGAAAADAGERLTDLEEWLDAARDALDVPGVGLAVVYRDEVVLARGFGERNVAGGLPVTEDTLFAIGSSSKAFTAFVLGTLVDEGVLGWDDPVREHLPGFRLHDEYAGAHLTIRDTLTHRCGLPRHDLVWYANPDLPAAELVARLPHFEPTAELRQTWQYNNLMFVTAGHLAGQVAGSSWAELIRARIFEPLGMSRSNVSVDHSQADEDHARPYGEKDDAVVEIPFRDITHVGPAGSINSSARDMAQWLRVQLGAGQVDDVRLIEAATVNAMHTPQMVIGGLSDDAMFSPRSYGMAWMVDTYRGHLRVGHGGNIDGFSALVTLFPRNDLGVVVLTNKNATALPELATREIADRVLELEERDWLQERVEAGKKADEAQDEAEADEPRVEDTAPAHALAAYAGTYGHPGYGELVFVLEDSALRVDYYELGATLEHWHFETFRAPEDDEDNPLAGARAIFLTDADGQVAAVTMPFESALAPIRFERAPDAKMLDPEYLRRLEGTYELAGQRIVVALAGDRLTVAIAGQPTYILEPRGNDRFGLGELEGFSVSFEVAEDGTVPRMTLHQPNGSFSAKRAED